MKKNKVGNLPPIGFEIPVDDLNKPEVLQLFKNAQCSGFATIRLLANHGYCRVNLAIIGPKPEQDQHNPALLDGEADHLSQEVADLVETLEQEAFGEDTAS